MPLYEYRCTFCQHQFEERRAFGDHVPRCPLCGEAVCQVYGSFLFRFRRRGWKPYSIEDSEGAETVKEERAYG